MGEKEINNNQNKYPVARQFKNAILGATMADQPAIMTASGWRQNEKGDYVQDQQNDPDIKKLKSNLSSISEMSPSHPIGVALFGFGKGIQYGLQNLPVVQKLISHPTWQKIYHGSPFRFSWKEAKPYSKANIGLHVSPNKKVAESFSNNIIDGYAPKPKRETIDIGFNNYKLLNDKYKFIARPKGGYDSYPTVLPDTKRFNMLKEAGANPSITLEGKSILRGDQYIMNTENPAILNLRKNLKLSKQANVQADKIMEKSKAIFPNKDEILNKEATELLSKDGIKTIKYHNVYATEGGGGESWILTDPSIVWNPTWSPIGVNIDLRNVTPIIPLLHE